MNAGHKDLHSGNESAKTNPSYYCYLQRPLLPKALEANVYVFSITGDNNSK